MNFNITLVVPNREILLIQNQCRGSTAILVAYEQHYNLLFLWLYLHCLLARIIVIIDDKIQVSTEFDFEVAIRRSHCHQSLSQKEDLLT